MEMNFFFSKNKNCHCERREIIQNSYHDTGFSRRPHLLATTTNSESGNILIYILGAIFLLGLLVVISKGSVTPGASIDHETLMIRVSEVQEYGKELEQAVSYVMANGHSEVDIRFAHPDASSAYGDITDTPSRQVFSRDGGGARYREPPEGIQTTATDWIFTGNNKVNNVGTSICGATSQCSDIIALLRSVTLQFCLAINDKNDIPSPANAPPVDDNFFSFSNPFVGDLTHLTAIYSTDNNLNGKFEGCFQESNPSNDYNYYRVLLAR